VLLSSAVCFYIGLCVVEQYSMLLRWSVCCWAEQYIFPLGCKLLSSTVCCDGGQCVVEQCSIFFCWAVCC